MCKPTFLNSLRIGGAVACLLMAGFGSMAALGQAKATSPATAVALPTDPAELMMLTAKMNGLTGADMKPWHIKASYTVMDEQGDPRALGTFEELWAGPHKNRVTFTSGAQSQTTYSTDHGIFRVGSLEDVPDLALEARNLYVEPMPDAAFIQHEAFESAQHDVGGAKITCMAMKQAPSAGSVSGFPNLTYCIHSAKPFLRAIVTFSGTRQAQLNNIVVFQGKFVPKDVKLTHLGKDVMSAHLVDLGSLATANDADFTPPMGAAPVPEEITISSWMANELVMKSSFPAYPLEAKAAGVEGTVYLHITIGKNGHVKDVQAVGGPAELLQAAKDSVAQRVYKPYRLNGEVVEVETTVKIAFVLGG
jgi:TonB family protein